MYENPLVLLLSVPLMIGHKMKGAGASLSPDFDDMISDGVRDRLLADATALGFSTDGFDSKKLE